MNITRRDLAKGVAVAGLSAAAPRLMANGTSPLSSNENGNWMEVYPGVWRTSLGTPEAFTPVSNRGISPADSILERLPKAAPPEFRITGQARPRGFRIEIPLRPGEEVFGLGLQMMGFAHRGRKLTIRVNADPRSGTGDSHAPVPFYVTTDGYGVLVDTARYGTFYFDNAHPKPIQSVVQVESNSSPDPAYVQDADKSRMEQVLVEIPVAKGVDVYFFAGPDMLTAVRRYNAFSGGGFIPPEWGLGFWYRVDARSTQASALRIAREFRDHKIPCDVLGLEPGWQSHAYSCTFMWNRDRFHDPSRFIRDAAGMQYKINLWEHAFTHPASPLFPLLQDHSGDLAVWGGLVPDFASKSARRAFGTYHGTTFIDESVSGFKLDECDNSDYTGGWSFPECSQFPSGIDGEQMHSVFGLGYQQAIWEQFRQRNRDTYGLVRSSGALAAPYPFVLYSDLYNHRDFVRALVNSGFSGLLWCPEVRDAESQEDLIRRLQTVVFSPLAMVNGWYIKNPPWMQLNRAKNNDGELLANWGELEARCREIIGWRMRLVPYLKAAFAQYKEDGTPPFRALIMDSPGDSRFRTVDDQYMVGDRMMIAPLFAGEAERKILLPEGGWHDFWSGRPIPGNTEITVAAVEERIPVYVKAGSIVALADVASHAGAPESRQITPRVYGDGSLPAKLVDGDKTCRLHWANEVGSIDGELGQYVINAWQQIGV